VQAESHMRDPSSSRFDRDISVLSRIKNRLNDFFGVPNDIAGAHCIQDTPEGKDLPLSEHETLRQAYMRKIRVVLTDRLRPTFDYVQIVNAYVRRAEQKYGPRKQRRGPSSRKYSSGKRFP